MPGGADKVRQHNKKWIHRTAKSPHLPETERHSRSGREYGFDFKYQSRPSWDTYASLLQFAGVVRRDLPDLKPGDMIDIQSFIWVQGSDEYEE